MLSQKTMTLANNRPKPSGYRTFLNWLIVSACLCLAGCSALLPSSDIILEGQWNSFEDAQKTFDTIIPYQTTVEDLNKLGLDLQTTPNLTLLNSTGNPWRSVRIRPGRPSTAAWVQRYCNNRS